ncbi:MAG: CCA tRNA nucleotidyltransferase [Calditrichaeota bacterium]|nr:CCA tRNA nucleotidyltransferase [Calditrichota bacterium]
MTTINQLLAKISEIAGEKQVEVYPVGGFVRDCLLKIESKDIDFVVIGDGISFAKKLAKRLNGKNLTVFKTFGTAHFSVNDFELEFVAARKESYRHNSRKPIVEKTDLQTDLSRRDFTINAMAMHIDENRFGRLIDPFSGQSDLNHKLVRTPLDPEIAFNDDPLRILRAIRFAARYGFKIDTITFKSMQSHVPRLEIVSVERISDELKQILEGQRSDLAMQLLADSGIIRFLLPELEAEIKILIRFFADPDNQALSFQDKLAVAFAVNGVKNKQLKQISLRMRFSNEITRFIGTFIQHFRQSKRLLLDQFKTTDIKHFLYSAEESYNQLLRLTSLWLKSQGQDNHLTDVEKRIAKINQNSEFSQFKLALNGHQIAESLAVNGRQIGKVKEHLTELVLNEKLENDANELSEYLRSHKLEFK